MIKEKFLKFVILLFIINFRVLAKNSKLEIEITTNKDSRKNFRKTIYFEKKKYTKEDLVKKINEQIDIDSKKDEEDLNKEIEKFENDLKPLEDKISKIKKDLNDIESKLRIIEYYLSNENITDENKRSAPLCTFI